MPEICYTATQVKFIKWCIVLGMSLSIYQYLTIRRLSNNLNRGRAQFNNIKEGAEYLLNVIEANGIDLTEFDLIALTAIIEDKSPNEV